MSSGAASRVLVTGGAGFIGSHLAERLCREGHRVRVLDNLATGKRENLAPVGGEIELVEGDVRSYEQVHRCVRGCDLVFHQAALPSVPRSIRDPLTSHESNATGTLNVLLAARDEGVRRVIFASSSSVYGANPQLPWREEHRRAADRPVPPSASWRPRTTAGRSPRSTGSRRSRSGTSTSSGRARTRSPSTRR